MEQSKGTINQIFAPKQSCCFL